MPRLLYTRYTILSSVDITDKFDFLLNGLKNEAKVLYRNRIYGFFDTAVIELEGKEYITGHLVKYNPKDTEEVVDEETNKLRDENLTNKVVAKGRFIIDPKSSILMFVESYDALLITGFINMFSQLFELNYTDILVELNINPIKEQYTFIEKVRTLKSIKKIGITLYPSNPNFAERWRKFDERLRENQITKYREVQENTKPDSSIVIDEDTESKFQMAEDGYGKSYAYGTSEEGEEKRISTNSVEKIISKPLPPNLDNVVEVLRITAQTLQDIINRTK